MKKLLFAICMMLVSASSFAQQGTATVGVHGDYMIDTPHNFGIGANVGYEFLNNVRGVAEFNYFLSDMPVGPGHLYPTLIQGSCH